MKRLLQRRKKLPTSQDDGDEEPSLSSASLPQLTLPSYIPSLASSSENSPETSLVSVSSIFTHYSLCMPCQTIAAHLRHDTLKSLRQPPRYSTPYSVLCNLDGIKDYLTNGAISGCQLCSLRLEHSEKNSYETLGELGNELIDIIFSDPMEFKHPESATYPATSYQEYKYVQAWCTKAGDFVSSVPEGPYRILYLFYISHSLYLLRTR